MREVRDSKHTGPCLRGTTQCGMCRRPRGTKGLTAHGVSPGGGGEARAATDRVVLFPGSFSTNLTPFHDLVLFHRQLTGLLLCNLPFLRLQLRLQDPPPFLLLLDPQLHSNSSAGPDLWLRKGRLRQRDRRDRLTPGAAPGVETELLAPASGTPRVGVKHSRPGTTDRVISLGIFGLDGLRGCGLGCLDLCTLGVEGSPLHKRLPTHLEWGLGPGTVRLGVGRL
mmetsp:Transcript_106410/g.183476  ORF Transcript_106410/g.183476 Transcript_106410/m.183476 type:complete len:224 (-) Transcript_106410:1268-1939(-)